MRSWNGERGEEGVARLGEKGNGERGARQNSLKNPVFGLLAKEGAVLQSTPISYLHFSFPPPFPLPVSLSSLLYWRVQYGVSKFVAIPNFPAHKQDGQLAFDTDQSLEK